MHPGLDDMVSVAIDDARRGDVDSPDMIVLSQLLRRHRDWRHGYTSSDRTGLIRQWRPELADVRLTDDEVHGILDALVPHIDQTHGIARSTILNLVVAPEDPHTFDVVVRVLHSLAHSAEEDDHDAAMLLTYLGDTGPEDPRTAEIVDEWRGRGGEAGERAEQVAEILQRRVYVDLSARDEAGRVLLTSSGTQGDLEAYGITLTEGLRLSVWSGEGGPDDLVAEGVAEFDEAHSRWTLVVDEESVLPKR